MSNYFPKLQVTQIKYIHIQRKKSQSIGNITETQWNGL